MPITPMLEERITKRSGHPGLARHRREHADLRFHVEALQARAAQCEVTMTIEVDEFLIYWLKRHTISSDLRTAAYPVSLQSRPYINTSERCANGR